MYVSLHELAKGCIYQTVALDTTQCGEGRRDDTHRIMATTITGADMARMPGAVVLDIQFEWCQARLQPYADGGQAIIAQGNVLRKGLMVTRVYTPAAT